MRFTLLLVLTICSCCAWCQDLVEVRSRFHAVVLEPENAREFHDYITSIEKPTSTVLAYQAVSEAMLAQVIWNPFTKIKQVIKYDKMMTKAIDQAPSNVEIRFLRLAIEYNLPAFLGMSKHLDEDLEQIVSNLSSMESMQVNPKFGQYIFYFLDSTDLCTQKQLGQMKEGFEKSSASLD